MSSKSKNDWSRFVGFKLESPEKRKELEQVRLEKGYTNLADYLRDLIDDQIDESE